MHRAFWLVYAVTSLALFMGFGIFEARAGMGTGGYGFISTATFMLVQEALFLFFIRLERLYLPYLKSGHFHVSLALSNSVVISALAVAGFWKGIPEFVPGLLFSGYGLVGGNLGCALSLALAFRIADVISTFRRKPLRAG